MEILRVGHVSGWPRQLVCGAQSLRGCGAILNVERADVSQETRVYRGYPHDIQFLHGFSFVCACCGTKNVALDGAALQEKIQWATEAARPVNFALHESSPDAPLKMAAQAENDVEPGKVKENVRKIFAA